MKRIKLHHRETNVPVELSLNQIESIAPDSNGSIKHKSGKRCSGLGWDTEPQKWSKIYLKSGTMFEVKESYLEIKSLCLQ
jgi:hypothetical protein